MPRKRTASFHQYTASDAPPSEQPRHRDDLLLEIPQSMIPKIIERLAAQIVPGILEWPAHLRFHEGKLVADRTRKPQ